MIRLGPAGSPARSTLEGIRMLKDMGLDAMEVEFTHGIRMKNELAREIGKEAEKLDIKLSVHAPYFINLVSESIETRENSIKRILLSSELASEMKAKCVVFHPAYYGKHSKNECYEIVKDAIMKMQEDIRRNNWNVRLCPETTGKHSQFGDLDETLRLANETGCGFCIDFAHIRARNQCIDYEQVLEKLKVFKHIHSHFSGIEYTAKGERYHKNIEEKEFLPLAELLLKKNIDITIISESPVTWQDSLRMKQIIESLRVRERA